MTDTTGLDAKLLPCPFCGNAPNPVPQNDYCRLPPPDKGYFQTIWCENCGAQGAKRKTDKEAIAAWNRRNPRSPRGGSECNPKFNQRRLT